MPFTRSSSHLYYRNAQFFIMAMPPHMTLVMYDIPCILSYDFNKLTILYTYISSISMTNKSAITFFLLIKYLSVCLFVCLIYLFMY